MTKLETARIAYEKASNAFWEAEEVTTEQLDELNQLRDDYIALGEEQGIIMAFDESVWVARQEDELVEESRLSQF